METSQRKTKLELVIGTAHLIILAYSTANAIQGLYNMGDSALTKAHTKFVTPKKNHLKSVK